MSILDRLFHRKPLDEPEERVVLPPVDDPVPADVTVDEHGHTVISVSDVAPASEPLPDLPYKEAVDWLLNGPDVPLPAEMQAQTTWKRRTVEACSRYHGRLVGYVNLHPVIESVHRAYADHRPLVLSPDIVWLLIAQGFAHHINSNAEELRSKLVRHAGKIDLEVRRDDFQKGSLENPWSEVFDALTAQIREHVGEETYGLFLPRFSTTGPTEIAAAQVTLLDALQSFFSYRVMSMCGIPQIVLEGNADDWQQLAARVRDLARFGLAWWTDAVGPLIDEFVAAVRGRADRRFWQSIYKWQDQSGGPYVTGWITAFFPYLVDYSGQGMRKNNWLIDGGRNLQELLRPPLVDDPHRWPNGPTAEDFPSGVSRAPFVWNYFGRLYGMEFLGGFLGIRQDPDTLRLEPEIGWAVREAIAEGSQAH